jgi:hypothetical protein
MRIAGSLSNVNGVGHGVVAVQNVINHFVVFLLEAGVRNALHDAELLVGVGQLFVELNQVV